MIRTRVALVGAVACSVLVGVRADAQRGGPPAGQEAAAAANEKKVNLEGCVFPKRALSSKEPVTVPAGSPGNVDDYVVTNAHVISASTGLPALEGRVFMVKGVEQDKLRDLIGKRAQVSARVDDKPSMPELQVISMIETVGSCPLVPSPPQ